MSGSAFQYDVAGVDTGKAKSGLGRLAASINQTLSLRNGLGYGRPAMGLGYYANVLELPGNTGLAISTDGVGTKTIVAQLAGRYDTIGIDLIAMNVNDIICVGAEPFSMVDYVAVGEVDDRAFDELGRGLLEGCRECDITIPGGEIAQVRELIKPHGNGAGLDLVGTAVGLVPFDEVNVGQNVKPGDVILGFDSNGIHSNGYTLARRVLLDVARLSLEGHVAELGSTLADEMLRPTRIYVKPVVEMLKKRWPLNAILHITGDGYCNINRISANVGIVIDNLPEPQPIFALISKLGGIGSAEMYSVFNMGVGLCVVVAPEWAQQVIDTFKWHGIGGRRIGYATDEHPKKVRLTQFGLIGGADRLAAESK